MSDRPEQFPIYKRSPRVIYEIPEKKIKIKSPESEKSISKTQMLQMILMPLGMLVVTIGMGVLLKRGLYILMGVATTSMTMIFSVIRFIEQKKDCKRKNEKRVEVYDDYLLSIRKQVYSLQKKEAFAHSYNYPMVSELSKLIDAYSPRIYERTLKDDDYLSVTVGREENKSSIELDYSYNEVSTTEDPLSIEAKELSEEFENASLIPVNVKIMDEHIGLVGRKDIIHEQIKVLVTQLVFFHSYHEICIVPIYNQECSSHYDWMRYLPHCRIEDLNLSTMLSNIDISSMVLSSIHEILQSRSNAKKESKETQVFSPYFIFIIDENKYIEDHTIMEYLQGEEKLGFSMIYISEKEANLPENISTIIGYDRKDDNEYGQILMLDRKYVGKDFELDHTQDIDCEWLARNLSSLVHEVGKTMSLPNSVSFFDMYSVKSLGDFEVLKRWQKNKTYKTMAVPVGIRITGEQMMLNLHEKAHGPHGLVAGTTGSGKSEILQTYILSLAINYHPYEVGFLLIDYKGGGMAHLFENLPHLLGTITNLDSTAAMRALVSIKSELARRQRIFMANDVNHINGYNKLFEAGKVKEPLPHLLLISDEFAELKKEQPDFMSELVSTARLGRSLGIHLILATQKPGGVVTDQIWTNSKFKLALKVQDEGDSREVIKTPDAAHITQPGRAYLQVGNNEIYELFQSAFSGAEYNATEEGEYIDDRVYEINALGQPELINQDLSDKNDNRIVKTELDAIVEYLGELYQKVEHVEVKKPWLPPLENMIITPYLTVDSNINDTSIIDVSVPLGIVDIPEKQIQSEYRHNFIEDGNLGIYGASGYGKTTIITLMALSIAAKNSAELVNYYILDLGNSGLISLKKLPHTADYISFDDVEKLKKFMAVLQDEIGSRKKKFAKVNAMNFEMYNKMSADKLPAIIWFIDNYDVAREMLEDIEVFVTKVTRDCAGLGIFVCLTASRPGATRYSLLNNIKTKIALKMFENSDIHNLVGRTKYEIPDVKGRALVKLEDANYMQFYAPFNMADSEEYVGKVNEFIKNLDDNYEGKKPLPIPMMPEELTINVLNEYIEKVDENLIPIGLNTESITPEYIDLTKMLYLIVGATGMGRTNLSKVIVSNLSENVSLFLIDDSSRGLYDFRDNNNVTYIQGDDDKLSFVSKLREIVEERRRGFIEANSESQISAKDYFAKIPYVVVMINELEEFGAFVAESNDLSIIDIIKAAKEVNVTFIVSANANRMKCFDAVSKFFKEAVNGIVVGQFSAQSHFTSMVRIAPDKNPGIGYILDRGNIAKVKIAHNK